jgi:hypothetical protein
MNTAQLQKRVGLPHRLRPKPWRFTQNGQRLGPRDDQWTLEESTKKGVLLKNASTGHNLKLGPENVGSFTSPDFLILKCQVIIYGHRVLIEPINGRS